MATDELAGPLLCNLICRSAERWTAPSGKLSVKMVLEVVDGPAVGTTVKYWYLDSVPFAAAVMRRNSLPPRDSDLSILVGREFSGSLVASGKYPQLTLIP